MSQDSQPDPPTTGWIVTTCPSCEREVKLRSSIGRDEVACPYCSERLSPQEEVEEEVLDPGTGGETPADEAPGPESDWHGGSTQRVKRRVGQTDTVEEPEWDRDPSEANVVDQDEDVTEFVEVDPENPDQLRKRRVKRQRPATAWEKLSGGMTIAFIALVVAGSVALLVVAVVQGTRTASKDIKEIAELPDKVQALIAAARAEGVIPTVLTEDETKAAEAIVRGFLEAEGWEAKLPYVYKPERAAPRMEEWYGREENDDSAVPTRVRQLRDKIIDNGRYVIKMAMETYPGTYTILALRQTPDDIKIHWESTAGYQPLTLAEFKEQRPTEPVPFRVKVERNGYYNHEFSDEAVYQNVSITYPGNLDFKLQGYIRRDVPELQKLLSDLEVISPSLVLGLRYPPTSSDANQVEVVSVVEGSWFD